MSIPDTQRSSKITSGRESSSNQLVIQGVSTFYGEAEALKRISIYVGIREAVAILGSNGAGKTTLLRTLTGLLKPKKGDIQFRGETITGKSPNEIVKKGISAVPEGRELFGTMSVGDNLILGAFCLGRRKRRDILKSRSDMIFKLFPVLEKRLQQHAETLSGGEQQMLALGRALMADPKLLALDEPSLGLAPLLVMEMMELLKLICHEWGVSILLVEQNARAAMKIADYVYVMERGEVTLKGEPDQIVSSPRIQAAYLGA